MSLADEQQSRNAAEIASLADQLALQERILGVAQKLIGTQEEIDAAPSIRAGMRVAAAGFGGEGQLAGKGALDFAVRGKDVQTQQLEALKSIDSKLGPGSRIPLQGALSPATP